MPKKKPVAPDFDALIGGDVIDLAALRSALDALDPANPKDVRRKMVLGNVLTVVEAARSVCGVKPKGDAVLVPLPNAGQRYE